MLTRERARQAIESLRGLPDQINALHAAIDQARAAASLTAAAAGSTVAAFDGMLREAHPPLCPKCGADMRVVRNNETGVAFLGCTLWKGPKSGCKGRMDYSKWYVAASARLAEVADVTGSGPRVVRVDPERVRAILDAMADGMHHVRAFRGLLDPDDGRASDAERLALSEYTGHVDAMHHDLAALLDEAERRPEPDAE